MSILRMETERARQAARQMLQARRTAEEEALALRRAGEILSSAWQGGAAADFQAQAGPRPGGHPGLRRCRSAGLHQHQSRRTLPAALAGGLPMEGAAFLAERMVIK